MAQAAAADSSSNNDFWPAQDLESWRVDPKKTFEAWLAQQRVLGVRKLREASCETYTAIFMSWAAHLTESGLSVLEAKTKDADAFFASVDLEPVSRRRYLQLLDRVYRHLAEAGRPGGSPLTSQLRLERQLDIALPPGMTVSAQAQLQAILLTIPGWKGARDRCAAALMLGAGLRANELIKLMKTEIQPDFTLVVTPAGVHKEHTTLILPEGPWRAWVTQWQQARAEKAIPGSLLCPATSKGVPYSPSGLFRRVAAWLAPIEEDFPQSGPNLLRNTFARQALTCGRYTPAEVQAFLGHEELRATARHLSALGVEQPSLC